MSGKKSLTPKRGVGKNVCLFCGEGKGDEEIQGKLLSKAGITAHYFCMLFSSGLSQNGESEKQGLLGFLPADITKEVKRGFRLRCSFCKKHGATIGCVQKLCKKNFHLGCGRQNGAFHLYYDTFGSYCTDHRPQQKVPADDDPNIVCTICMNVVKAAPCNESLRAPCCQKNWYHRECIQTYSKSAGLYFFKCPLCNNKEDFQQEMLKYGIYIPDQDAAWETEPNAYHELLERYQNCDAKVCKCVEGRNYDKEGSKWEIVLCNSCGSQGSHAACKYLVKHKGGFMCPNCWKIEIECMGSIIDSPKRMSFEQLQLQCSSSPEQTKQNCSEYPGPSENNLKRKLPVKFSSAKKSRLSLKLSASKSSSTVTKDTKSSKKTQSMTPDSEKEKKKKSQTGSHVKDSVKGSKSKTNKAGTTFMDRYFNSKLSSSPSSSEESSVEEGASNSILLSYLDNNQLMSAYDLKKSKKHKKQTKNTETIQVASESKKHKIEPNLDIRKIGLNHSQGKKKRLSDQKPQNTLDSWLKKPQAVGEKLLPEQTLQYVDGQVLDMDVKKSEKHSKKPTVIEWHGKQLIIRPSKVLRKTSGRKQKKPRNLNIDMVDEKGNTRWDAELDVLSSIEADIRVTRNMFNTSVIDDCTVKSVVKGSKRGRKRLSRAVKCVAGEDHMSPPKLSRKKKRETLNGVNIEPAIKEESPPGPEDKTSKDSPAKNLRVKKCQTTTLPYSDSYPTSQNENLAEKHEVLKSGQTCYNSNRNIMRQDSSSRSSTVNEMCSDSDHVYPHLTESKELNNNNHKTGTEYVNEHSPNLITGTSMFNFSLDGIRPGSITDKTDTKSVAEKAVPTNSNIEALKNYNFKLDKIGNTKKTLHGDDGISQHGFREGRYRTIIVGSSIKVCAAPSSETNSPSRLTRSTSLQAHGYDTSTQEKVVLPEAVGNLLPSDLNSEGQINVHKSANPKAGITFETPSTLNLHTDEQMFGEDSPSKNTRRYKQTRVSEVGKVANTAMPNDQTVNYVKFPNLTQILSETESASSPSDEEKTAKESPLRKTRSAALQIRNGSDVRKVFNEIFTASDSMLNDGKQKSTEGNRYSSMGALERREPSSVSEVNKKNSVANENMCPNTTTMTKLKKYLIKRYENETDIGSNDKTYIQNNDVLQLNNVLPNNNELTKLSCKDVLALSPRSVRETKRSSTAIETKILSLGQTKSDLGSNDKSVMSAYYSPTMTGKTHNISCEQDSVI